VANASSMYVSQATKIRLKRCRSQAKVRCDDRRSRSHAARLGEGSAQTERRSRCLAQDTIASPKVVRKVIASFE
jgi:hypothetical protein